MPTTTEPNSLLYTFENFEDGDTDWGPLMVENFRRIGRVGFHLSVIDRSLTEPPSQSEAGDTYIVAAGGAGDWSGQDDNIAVYAVTETSNGWLFFTPRAGWIAYIEDEEVLSAYKGSSNGWSAGASI